MLISLYFQYKFGDVLVPAKKVNTLTALTKHAPTAMFPRFCELIRGRKYCLRNVLMGTRGKKKKWDEKCRMAIFGEYTVLKRFVLFS